MVKIICDRCGGEIENTDKVGYISWNFHEGIDGRLLNDNIFEKNHYCTECMGEIKAFIEKNVK